MNLCGRSQILFDNSSICIWRMRLARRRPTIGASNADEGSRCSSQPWRASICSKRSRASTVHKSTTRSRRRGECGCLATNAWWVVQTRGCARAPATSPSEIACLVPAPTHTDPMEPSRQAENVCIASWVLSFHSEKPLIVNLYTGNVQVNREAAVPALRHDSSWYRISRFPAKPTLPARHRRALCGNI
jgi:hypothetical protein